MTALTALLKDWVQKTQDGLKTGMLVWDLSATYDTINNFHDTFCLHFLISIINAPIVSRRIIKLNLCDKDILEKEVHY